MMRRALSAPAVVTIVLLATGAADPAQPWAPGELIVKFRAGVSAPEKGALVRGKPLKALRLVGAEHWRLDDAGTVAATIAALEADPRVEYAEPNYLIHTLGVPNDPLFDRLWGLHNTGQMVGTVIGVPGADIDAVAAWDVATGSADVTVAVIDTGIDTSHPDLAPNLWINPGEIAGNGVDDDGNGFIDDIHGWDFINNDNDPMDDNSHGTHCAGTIGAVADNGAGGVGVNWNVRLMALKFQGAGGEGTTVDAIECITYATLMGVDVMSNSWGSGARSTPLQEAIQAAADADIFFVASAGNSGLDNDDVPFFPASYDVGNVITVMATDCRDQPAVESTWATNYGATTVDIAAPGVRIWSTIRNNGYMYLSGTSMAAPYVAGGLALLRSRFPDISVADARFLLMNVGNDPLPSLFGKCASGGRLNLRRLIADPDTDPPAAVTDLAIGTVASNWLTLDWTTPGDNGTLVSYDLRWAATPIVDEAGWAAAMPLAGEPAPTATGAWATMRVEGLPAATTCYFSLRATDEYGNVGLLSNSPGGETLGPPQVTIAPATLSAAVEPGGTALRTLTITNTGQGVLDFTIPRQGPAKPWSTAVEVAGAEAVTDASGRVDAYGYDWSDSDTPGGPAFNWIDISSKGTAVPLTDESSRGPFNLGFTFPFYGRDFTTFYVSANGCVNFAGVWTPGVNVALPSASASGYLLALLWDQLTPGVGTCRYFNDGNRMIVQYTNVDNSGAGGPYTMQMHMYATGVIEYHYRTLVSPASGSATIGIQNGDGSDGLTVAYNTAYVHDNLAVRFQPPPTWLSVSPDNGNLAPGTSVDVAVRFDGTGLCGSHFAGKLRVLSNDPAASCVLAPVGLDVANPPNIATDPAGVAFGAVRFGLSSTRTFAVTNISCGDLTIHSLDFDSGAFTSTQALPLVIPYGATANVPVTFAPLAPAPFTGTVTVGSDDPDLPSLVVPLSGTGLHVPDIVVAPASLDESLPTGGTSTRTLTITNAGLSDLTYTVAAPEYISVGNKGAGGPDTYGYVWTDSDAAGGPAYNWIEISTIGTVIPFTGDDENRGPMPIGFSFPFYGTLFTTYRINANGWISFTNTSTGFYNNSSLPSPYSAPENMIAPYWDDLTFVNALGKAYRHFDGQRLIIEYVAVPRDGRVGTCTFQTHLYPNGRIEFHYRDMPMTLDSATIGIQNATRNSGLTVAWNNRYVHNDMAVRIDTQQHWLSAASTGGTIVAGASADIAIGFDAAGLCGRTCQANLRINSNDIDTPQVVVPVTLTATSAPTAKLTPASLGFGDVYVSQSPALGVSLASIGCAPLVVTGLVLDNPAFTASTTAPFTLAAGATRAFNITCTPLTAGAITGSMTLTTNDPSRPTISMPLSVTGHIPPGVAVTPGTVAMTVQPNRQRSTTIRLDNTGAGTLNYSIATPSLIDKATGVNVAPAGGDKSAEGDASVLGTGGPDAYGYRWLDSDAPGGPVFSWIEIAGSGAVALTSGGNVSSAQCQLGFNVGLYGPQYTSFYVGSEGFLAFQPFGFNSGGNATIPSSLGAPAMVAPFWDDLDLDAVGSGDVWYKKVDGNMVVEWDHVMRAGTSTPVTFEAIIKPSGQIIFQYLSVSQAVTNSATIGIQNAAQTVGLRIAYNAPYVHDNLAVQIWLMPQWATVSPSAGNIPPGGSTDLTVTFNTTGLPVTTHHGQLTITSNDLLHPTLTIPLTLTVLDYPSGVDGEPPRALSLAQNAPNPFNPRTLIRFGLPAKGMVDLRIYDVSGRLVRTLVNGDLDAGTHDYLWDGRTDAGASSPSGVYFYRLKTAAGDLTRSMTLVR